MKKILVVDDQAELREAMQACLELCRYEVVTASNGQEGVEMARSVLPDLILLDISMPKMSGLEALAQLKSFPQTATLPVVMVSAEGDSGNLFETHKLRAEDFLIKPFTAEQLVEMVKRHIR